MDAPGEGIGSRVGQICLVIRVRIGRSIHYARGRLWTQFSGSQTYRLRLYFGPESDIMILTGTAALSGMLAEHQEVLQMRNEEIKKYKKELDSRH